MLYDSEKSQRKKRNLSETYLDLAHAIQNITLQNSLEQLEYRTALQILILR
jgi:hypothetical protein